MLHALIAALHDQVITSVGSLLPPFLAALQRTLRYVAHAACTERCCAYDHTRLETSQYHFHEEPQGSLCHPTLPACADRCCIGDRIRLGPFRNSFSEQQGLPRLGLFLDAQITTE